MTPGHCVQWFGTQDGTSATQGSWRASCNNNGTISNRFPVTDFNCIATGLTDHGCEIDGSLVILPQGSLPGSMVAGYAGMNLKNGSHNTYMYQDDAAGDACGIAYATCIVGDSLQPIIIGTTGQAIYAPHLPSSAGSVAGSLCIDTSGEIYIKTTSGACK